jgi:hypothetical protein
VGDVVFVARIVTMDEARPDAEALGVSHGRVTAIGSLEWVRAALPDAFPSAADVVAAVRQAVAERPHGAYLNGWDPLLQVGDGRGQPSSGWTTRRRPRPWSSSTTRGTRCTSTPWPPRPPAWAGTLRTHPERATAVRLQVS